MLHRELMCRRCFITNREAAVLGRLNICDVPARERDDAVAELSRLREHEANQ